MGETQSFFETPLANSQYLETQRQVIERLHVGKLSEVLPPDILAIYDENHTIEGRTRITLNEKEELLVYNQQNGITELTKVRKEGKLPTRDVYSVQGYYFVDSDNQTAWDAFQLWETSSPRKEGTKPDREDHQGRKAGQANILLGYPGQIPEYMADGYGGLLFLGRFADNPKRLSRALRAGLDKNQIELMDSSAPMHEAGHRYQLHELADQTEVDFRHGFVHYFVFSYIHAAMRIHPVTAKLFQVIPYIKKSLETEKFQTREAERNAWAFASGAIQKLRDQKLDICRGLDNEKIAAIFHRALNTYDHFYKYVSGPQFVKQTLI